MKILHTSDWHIGQHFYRFDREDEHLHFFVQLSKLVAAEKPDAMVVCGDVFHNPAPSASARQIFVEGVLMVSKACPTMSIIITAGNHDSGVRLEADRELWNLAGVHVVGGAKRNVDGTFDPGQFIIDIAGKGAVLAVPYFHPSNYPLAEPDEGRENRREAFYKKMLEAVETEDKPIVLLGHMAVMGSDIRGHEDDFVGGMLKDDLSIFGSGYDYLALGHIHMPQDINERVGYSGSVVPVSFSEDFEHSVSIVEISKHGEVPTVRRVPLDVLRRVKTVPPNGAHMDEALAELATLDKEDNSYVRLLVDQEGPMPADAEIRANAAVKGKACRFCEVIKKPRTVSRKEDKRIKIDSVKDFKAYTPMQIAQLSYERITGEPMGEEMKQMMLKAIEAVEISRQL